MVYMYIQRNLINIRLGSYIITLYYLFNYIKTREFFLKTLNFQRISNLNSINLTVNPSVWSVWINWDNNLTSFHNEYFCYFIVSIFYFISINAA